MGLLAWYKLDGDLLDSSGNENHLSYINNTGKLVYDPAGKIKGCYKRNVLNDGADSFRSPSTLLLDGSFTMACWAKVSALHMSTANGLITNHVYSDNSGAGITVADASENDFRISCNTGNGVGRTYNTYRGTSNIKDRWAHLLLRYDKNTNHLSLWVDGVMEFEIAYDLVVTSDYVSLFQWSNGYDYPYYKPACLLDDVRIYDHALSTKEIKELAMCKIAHYDFNIKEEPAKNLLENNKFSSTAIWEFATNGGGTFTVANNYGKINVPAAGSYHFLYQTVTKAIPPNTPVTFSVYFKNDIVGTFALRLVMFEGANVVQPLSAVTLDGTGGLKRFSVTGVHTLTVDSFRLDILAGSYYSYFGPLSDKSVEFTKVQFEIRDHATEFTETYRDARISDVSEFGNHITLTGPEKIRFNNVVNVSIVGNDITKIGTVEAWDAGCTSMESFTEDCFVEWQIDYKDNTSWSKAFGAEMVGFNSNHSTESYTDIDFAIYTHGNGHVNIYENGANPSLAATWSKTLQDVFRIEVVDSKVRYYLNGNLIYTSLNTPTFPLYFDMSMHSHGKPHTIKNVKIGKLPTIQSIPNWVAEADGPAKNGCYRFDGKNDYLYLNNIGLEGFKTGTVMFWYKEHTILNTLIMRGSNTSQYLMASAAGNGPFYNSQAGAPMYYVDGVPGDRFVNDGQWHHYTAVGVDLSTWSDIYINKYHADWELKGSLADLRFYNTLLSQNDIQNIIKIGASIDNDGNVFTKKLNENFLLDENNVINLVRNGCGEYGNNINFSQSIYDPVEKAFSVTSAHLSLISDDYIEIKGNSFDKWDDYRIEGSIKGVGSSSAFYFMFVCYDKNKRFIAPRNINHRANTYTTLTQPLNPGDLFVYLGTTANWYYAGTGLYDHNQTISMWKTDTDEYPPFTYSTRSLSVVYVDKVNNYIKLESPYSGEVIPAGSPACNSYDSGTYSYTVVNNTVDGQWTNMGVDIPGTPNTNGFRYGTKYVTVGFLINYSGGVTTSKFKNMRFFNKSNAGQLPKFNNGKNNTEHYSLNYNDLSEVGVTDGLMGYWKFDGDVKDYSGNINNATAFGSLGIKKDRIIFDGNSALGIPHSDSLKARTGMITMICVLNFTTSDGEAIIACKEDAYEWRIIPDGTFQRAIKPDWRWDGTLKVTPNVPTFVASVWTPKEDYLYVNDNKETITAGARGLMPNDTVGNGLGIGDRGVTPAGLVPGFTTNEFFGEMYYFKLFDRALSHEEIMIEYDLLMKNVAAKVTKQSKLYLRGAIKEDL